MGKLLYWKQLHNRERSDGLQWVFVCLCEAIFLNFALILLVLFWLDLNKSGGRCEWRFLVQQYYMTWSKPQILPGILAYTHTHLKVIQQLQNSQDFSISHSSWSTEESSIMHTHSFHPCAYLTLTFILTWFMGSESSLHEFWPLTEKKKKSDHLRKWTVSYSSNTEKIDKE